MKKIYLFLILFSGIIFTSCTSENEDVFLGLFVDESFSSNEDKYSVTLMVVNESLVNSLYNPYDNALWFDNNTLTGNDNVRTNILIYNSNGTLVDRQIYYNQSFTTQVVQYSELAAGTYTILTVVDIVSNQTDTYWKLIDVNQLNTAKVQFANYTPQYNGLLASSTNTLYLTYDNQYLNIYPSHIGSYITLHFTNLDYVYNRYVTFKYDINPDTYILNTQTNSYTLNYYSENTLDFENIYSAYYTNFYILPKTNFEIQYYIKNNYGNVSSTTRYVNISATAGNHKRIDINTATSSYSTYYMAPPMNINQELPVQSDAKSSDKHQIISYKLKDLDSLK